VQSRVPGEPRRHRPDQYRSAISAEDGKFSLRGIPPGDYKLFAWQFIETNAYLNREFMRHYDVFGKVVTVVAGDNESIELRLIQ